MDSKMKNNRLDTEDYVVIGAMLAISTGIGIYYRFTGGRQKTTEEYFMANRSMGIVPVAVGLMASFLSAVSLLGLSSEFYYLGTQYYVIYIGYGIATYIVSEFYIPVFFNLGGTSAYEYLQQRFGSVARFSATLAFTVKLLLYTSVSLYAPALALEATTGLPTYICVYGVGTICTFYSTLGGMKAVLMTDVFQSILMIIAVLAVIISASIEVGGVDRIWDIAAEGGRIEFDNISPDPTVRYTWWSITFGGLFTYLALYGVNQVQIQRMLSTKTISAARKALWWSWPMASVMSFFTCFAGLAIYTKYRNCDPLSSKRITSGDQIMPLYVMDTLSHYPGVAGLFTSGILSGALSTISAMLNSLAAVLLEDYIKPIFRMRKYELTSTRSAVLSKFLVVMVGVACLVVSVLVSYVGGIFQAALTVLGIISGPLLGLFSLGMFTETANEKGAVFGFFASVVFSCWIGLATDKPPTKTLPVSTTGCGNDTFYALVSGALSNQSEIFTSATVQPMRADDDYFYLYRISYMWYCPLGFLVCMVVGWAASLICRLIFRENSGPMNPDLFTPYLAKRIRKRQPKTSIEINAENGCC